MKRDWRCHLTPEERREIKDADRLLKDMRSQCVEIVRGRNKIVNRAINRAKRAHGGVE